MWLLDEELRIEALKFFHAVGAFMHWERKKDF